DDPSSVYRQRVYSFAPDYEEGAVRLTIYTPKDPEALLGAHEDPSLLDGLTPDDMALRPGCEVFWKRRANQFEGYMKENACSFVSERSGKRIFIRDDLILTDSEIWIRDQATDADGGYVFGNKAGVPHKNKKARAFTCWMSIKERNGDKWSFAQGLKIHDQGGMAWSETDERRPQKAGFRMRNVVWPYGRNKPSLVLYVHREGEEKAVSYAWSEPSSERIGINLRWVQGSCTLDRDDWTND
ncbi:MAG: chromophore lyase CpcT/CpeT, partial [Pseudomonadota bacterium]